MEFSKKTEESLVGNKLLKDEEEGSLEQNMGDSSFRTNPEN